MKTHGRKSTYSAGCRCAECRVAHTDYIREYNHRKGLRQPLAEYHAEVRSAAEARDNHGTESRYRFGCRCDECKQAQNKARARRRRSPNVKTHNNAGYSNGCRCDICRKAHNHYTRERRTRA